MVKASSLIRRGASLITAAPIARIVRPLLVKGKRPPDLSLVGVYRNRNGNNVYRLIESQGLRKGHVALWALDAEHPALANFTVGTGPGGRFPLLQACIDALMPDGGTWLVIVDDDVVVPHGGLQTAAVLARDMGLDIAQPAHSWNSFYTYPFTLARGLTIGRVTDFIEIGPVLIISPSGRDFLGSLSGGGSPMGWGVDVDWAVASREGQVVLGIIDVVAVRHLTRPGSHYERDAENRALQSSLNRSTAVTIENLQRDRYRRWLWRSPR